MTVSAAETRDPNGRPLDFHWRLLQGDPEKVTHQPLRRRRQRDDHASTGTTPSASPRTTRSITVPRRHRRLRLERRPRLRPGDPLLVLPPEREAPHRARPRRRAAHRRDRPRQPRPRLRRPDPRPPRRLARRLRLRRRRQPCRLDAGARATGRRETFDADGRRLPDPGEPRHRASPSPIRWPAPTTAGSWSRRSTPPPSEPGTRRLLQSQHAASAWQHCAGPDRRGARYTSRRQPYQEPADAGTGHRCPSPFRRPPGLGGDPRLQPRRDHRRGDRERAAPDL